MDHRKIAILGAHTALGKAVYESLRERELPLELRRYTSLDHLESELDPYSPDAIAEADLVVLTFRGPLAEELAAQARSESKPVVDAAGALAAHPDARYAWPILDPEAGQRLAEVPFHVLPSGLAGPLVALLRALTRPGARLAIRRAVVATYECAAAADQPGMDELSDQVRAVYTLRDAEPSVFPGRLAFSALPTLASKGSTAFDADDVLAREIALGFDGKLELRVVRVLVPAFSSDAAVVELEVEGEPDLQSVAAALRAGRGLSFVEGEAPSSIEAVGRDDALVGRLRVAPGRVGVWLASDRLRHGSATGVAVLLEQWSSDPNPSVH